MTVDLGFANHVLGRTPRRLPQTVILIGRRGQRFLQLRLRVMMIRVRKTLIRAAQRSSNDLFLALVELTI